MHIKTKIAGILMLAVLIVPGISFAQTQSAASLQALIATLTAQLQQLQAQLAAQTGGSTSWCYTFNTNLSVGMSGSAVSALQTALQKDGESVTVNGTFDDQTAAAVTGFQEKYASAILAPYNLNNGTGYAGSGTRAKLNSLFGCNGTTSPNPIPVQPVSPEPIATTTIPINVIFNVSANTITSGNSVTLSWTGSQNTGINYLTVTTCLSGVTMYDVTNNQSFQCSGHSVTIPGSDTVQLTSTNSTPTSVIFQLASSLNGMPLVQTITVNPVATTATTTSSINGGSLSVSQGVAATSLALGGTTQIVGAYNISNSQDGPVTLNTLKFQAGANASFFQNLRVYVNGVQFGSIVSAPSNAGSYVFSGSASLGGPDNNNNVQVVADVLSTASVGAQNTTSLSSCSAMPTGNPTYNGQTTTYSCNGVTGQTMTFGN
jgi:peptidoglycan hydrolase-like protein with peptidoglycan-binding domain